MNDKTTPAASGAAPAEERLQELGELREGLGNIAARLLSEPTMVKCCRLIDAELAALASREASPAALTDRIWKYRRYGSPSEKGYTIFAHKPGATHGEAVAFLGDSPEAADAVGRICEAHNAALASPQVAPAPEPVAQIESWTNGSYSRNYKIKWLKNVPEGAFLYLATPVQVAPLAIGIKSKCKTCGGSGVVDDGEIDCYEGGMPYENGPVKCVKDCPACATRAPVAPPSSGGRKATPAMLQAGAAVIDRETRGLFKQVSDGTTTDTARMVWREMNAAALVAPQDDARDAARYRFIRDVPYAPGLRTVMTHQLNARMDDVIDSLMSAPAAKPTEEQA